MTEISIKRNVWYAQWALSIIVLYVIFLVFSEPNILFLPFFWIILAIRSLALVILVIATKNNGLRLQFELETVLFIALGVQGFLIYISGEYFRSFEWFLGALYFIGIFNVFLKEKLSVLFS